MPLPKVCRIFWLGSVISFGLMLLLAGFGAHTGKSPSTWNPLGDPFLGDLLEYQSTFRLLHTAAFFDSTTDPVVSYPPFASVLFALMYSVPRPSVLYGVIFVASLATTLLLVRRSMIRWGVGFLAATCFPLTIILVSFPIEGLAQRGNLELFVWIFAAGGIWAFLHERSDTAAVLWAFAAATKVYPLIFFSLFFTARRFRSLAIGSISFIAIWSLSANYLGPTFAIACIGSIRNVFGYQGIRVAEWSLHELAANHSAFGLVKVAITVFGYSPTRLTLPYYAFGGLLFIILFFTRVRKMPVANQLLVVTLVMVMLPPVSYFYTLVHMYGSWLVLVSLSIQSPGAGERMKGLGPMILLFLPLFASFTLFTYPHLLLFGGLVQGSILFLMLLIAVRYPFENPAAAQPHTP